MTAPDDHDPMLTRALGIWAEAAVPSLPDDFTAGIMAEAMSQQAATAWAETAVPSLPDDFTASVMAGVATQRAAAVWAETAVPELPDDFAAQEVDGEVVDDAVEPGAEARSALEILEVAVHPEEGVLGDLPGVFGAADDAVGHRVGTALMAQHELLEGADVALRRAGDEVTVVLLGAGGILGLRRGIRVRIQPALAARTHRSRSFRSWSGAHVGP